MRSFSVNLRPCARAEDMLCKRRLGPMGLRPTIVRVAIPISRSWQTAQIISYETLRPFEVPARLEQPALFQHLYHAWRHIVAHRSLDYLSSSGKCFPRRTLRIRIRPGSEMAGKAYICFLQKCSCMLLSVWVVARVHKMSPSYYGSLTTALANGYP